MASNPVRITCIIDDLGLGGTQRQLVELLNGLPRERYDCVVISLSRDKAHYADAVRALGVPLVQIPQSGRWDWRCFWTLRRLLREQRPAIVHTWLFTADLYGRVAAWLAGVPVIVSAVRSVDPWKPRHHIMADRLLRRITQAFTVNARAIGQVLVQREGVPPSSIHTIYNGVDLKQLDPDSVNGSFRRRLGFDDRTPLVGIVGRFAVEKDHATFLRAAAQVLQRLPHVRFVLVGQGPLEADLKRLTQELRIAGQVVFMESQPRVADVFSALNVVAVSSRYEGCCNVILEGMAMGKPVVATAVGGNPELVRHEQTGLLVPAQDPGAFASAIIRLMDDPALADRLGQSGRARIEQQFSVSRMVGETECLYRALLRQRTDRA